ncbi:MAG: hypothetical protein EP329_21060 [Deltaproteobacteria bacterium]|nr:MAG: hypothetical protein EP329_21060 [Deltaproteobacteria bacterium]
MDPREIIPRTRSMVAAAGAFITSAGVVVLATGIVLDTTLPWYGQVATLGVGVLFALAMLTIALRLLAARGGLLVDSDRERIGIGVTSERDTWWVPMGQVVGIRVVADASPGQTIERWLAVLELKGRSSVVLARSEDRGTVTLVARRLVDATGFDGLEGEPAPEPPPEATDETDAPEAEAQPAPAPEIAFSPSAAGPFTALDFGVRHRGALQGMLFFFGISLSIVGVAMFTRVEHEPVFGFLFGPLLGLLGLALLGVTIAKRFAIEELRRDGEHFLHGYRLGKLRWGQRRIHARAPRWHMYVHGLRGAHLELLGGDGTLILGGGATTRSDIDLDALSQIPGRFAA